MPFICSVQYVKVTVPLTSLWTAKPSPATRRPLGANVFNRPCTSGQDYQVETTRLKWLTMEAVRLWISISSLSPLAISVQGVYRSLSVSFIFVTLSRFPLTALAVRISLYSTLPTNVTIDDTSTLIAYEPASLEWQTTSSQAASYFNSSLQYVTHHIHAACLE
jgi:hypothetical protein